MALVVATTVNDDESIGVERNTSESDESLPYIIFLSIEKRVQGLRIITMHVPCL